MYIHTYLSIVLGDYWLGDIFKNSCYDISLRLIKKIYMSLTCSLVTSAIMCRTICFVIEVLYEQLCRSILTEVKIRILAPHGILLHPPLQNELAVIKVQSESNQRSQYAILYNKRGFYGVYVHRERYRRPTHVCICALNFFIRQSGIWTAVQLRN